MGQQLDRFFQLSTELLCVLGANGALLQVNPAFERAIGCPVERLQNRTVVDLAHPEDAPLVARELERAASGTAAVSFSGRFRCPDGHYRSMHWRISPRSDPGELYARAEEIFAEAPEDEASELSVEQSPTAMLTVDRSGRITMANAACLHMFGYARAELVGQSVEVLVPQAVRIRHAGLREDFSSGRAGPMARPLAQARDLVAMRSDGSTFPAEIGLTPVQSEGNAHVLATIIDLTVRKTAEHQIVKMTEHLWHANRKLSALASTCDLTGLSNRRSFIEQLHSQLRLARRMTRPTSVLFADVDNFKEYNDRFGHPAGDALLRTLGQLLLQHTRGSDVAARLGGEEFGICLPETDRCGAEVVGEKVREMIAAERWPHRAVTASFGAATLVFGGEGQPEVEEAAAALIAKADRALYRSKNTGRNRLTHADDLS